MPPPRSRPVVAVVLAVAAMVVGCSSGPAGPPDPFPPRPVDIAIERLDPCALLSDTTRSELQMGGARAGTAPVRGVSTQVCGWSSIRTGYDYSVQFLPQDAADAVGAPGTRVGVVEGYGSVRVIDRVGSYPLCEIVVDVGEARAIRARAAAITRETDGSPRPADEVCRRAETVAADALRTAVRGRTG
ncbi:hypothetical protein AD006_22985 [Pseudonocardia sp. EC080610-09]|nr:hypothetical protein FRP1_15330 [Pseudonocardia sp. EC080625-04]ALL77459.1 hypothetical protein AD006_22985 [Pseudonocardia sp. EC080610-09]ALL80374.1 hypothetical protein AD017_02575 [Pseudonocardia sp. EC080619-01]